MNILDRIRTKRYHVLQVDLSNPEVHPSSCGVFCKLRDRIELEHVLNAMPLNEILDLIPKNSRVIVLFSGDQVLTRYSAEERSTLFEEIEEEEFYLQKLVTRGGWAIQSACRRVIIDTILDYIILNKRFLMDVSLSPTAIPILEGTIRKEILVIGHFQFSFGEKELEHIREDKSTGSRKRPDERINLSGTNYTPEQLSQMAALMHLLLEGPAHLSILKGQNIQNRFFCRFRLTVVLTLASLFVLLLVNFLLYSHLQYELSNLKKNGQNKLEKIHEIEGLKSQLTEFQSLRISDRSDPEETYSFYLEEIAHGRESGIWFNSLYIHPGNKRFEKGKPYSVDATSINIEGEAKDPASLNRFLVSLKGTKWISDIEVMHYEKSLEQPNADFEIIIKKK